MSDIFYTLPESWCLSTLGAVCSAPQYGFTTKATDKGSIRLLRTTDISSGQIDWESVPYCKENPDDEEKYLLENGDIVISRAGSVGLSHLLCDPERAVFASYLIRFRPYIDKQYFAYYLQSPFYWDAISEKKLGIAVPNVNANTLRAIRVPIPPLNEQRRIVAKIEELFSELDKGVESLTTAREQLKAYRQSVLKAAFEGKLTEDWRAKYPERLLGPAELEAMLKADGSVNAKRVPTHDLQDAATLPAEWAYFRVVSLCSVVRGGSPRPAGDPKYYGGHIPFLKVADLTHATGMYLSTHTSTIKEAGLTKTRMTPATTLLISNSGATLGVPKICTFETTFNDGVAAFLGVPQGYLEYFYFFWESKTAQLRGIDQGAAQPNLNTSLLGETLVPICSKYEARTLVDLLKSLLSTIQRQSEEIDHSLAQAAALRQAILKQAFSGKLVAQDPADEPASVLLERIRAELGNGSAKKRHNNKNGKKEAA